MKKILFLSILLLIACFSTTSYSDGYQMILTPSEGDGYYGNPPISDPCKVYGRYEEPNPVNTYLGQSSAKFGGGFANLFHVITLGDLRDDIGNSISEDGPLGIITGPLRGVAHMGYRATAASVQIGASPIPAIGPFRYPNGDAYDEYKLPKPNPRVVYWHIPPAHRQYGMDEPLR